MSLCDWLRRKLMGDDSPLTIVAANQELQRLGMQSLARFVREDGNPLMAVLYGRMTLHGLRVLVDIMRRIEP